MNDEWVTLRHLDFNGTTRIPANSPDVLAVHEARGWVVAEDTEDDARTPFVPPSGDGPNGDDAWIDLVHPGLPTGHQRIPNNAAAIEGAFQSGWRFPDPPAELVDQELRELRDGKGGKASKAQRAEAEERAAATAAGTDEPPTVNADGQNNSAGDGTQQEG